MSRNQWAIIRDMNDEPEPSLEDILARLQSVRSGDRRGLQARPTTPRLRCATLSLIIRYWPEKTRYYRRHCRQRIS